MPDLRYAASSYYLRASRCFPPDVTAGDNIKRLPVSRNEDCFVVIGDRDQPTIKHPMQFARQYQPVSHGKDAVSFDGADMGRFYFRAPSVVFERQTSFINLR